MKINLKRLLAARSSCVCLTIICAAIATSQGLPGGGKDSNPYNPANWNDNYAFTYTGQTIYNGWEDVSGVPTQVQWKNVWGDSFWTKDGVAQDPMIQPGGAVNNSNSTNYKEISASSIGTLTRKIKWIGIGSAPAKVLVDVSGFAYYVGDTLSSPTAFASNWEGRAETYHEEAGLTGKWSISEAHIYVNINSSTGIGEWTASQSATITALAFSGEQVKANAFNTSMYFADLGVGIKPWTWPTYYKDATTGLRTANSTFYLNPRYMDTVATYHDPIGPAAPHWDRDATFYKETWGTWTDPFNTWNANGLTWTDGFFVEYDDINTDYTWAWNTIVGLSPLTEDILLDVENQGSPWVTRTADLYMRVHLPLENVSTTTTTTRYSGWWKVNAGFFQVDDGEPGGAFEFGYARTDGVTSSIGYSVNRNAQLSIELLTAELGATIFGEIGKSTTWQTSSSVTFTVPANNSGSTRYYLVRRRWFWGEKTGIGEDYLEDGYNSDMTWTLTYFSSITKAAAQVNDFVEDLHWVADPMDWVDGNFDN